VPQSDRRRAVFLDVDGTLIDREERLAASSVDAVRQARAAGHLVFVCTGRAPAEISAAVRDIGFDGIISAGGAFIEHDGRLVAGSTMSPGQLAEIIGFLERERIEYILQGFQAVYPSTGLVERLRELLGELDVGDWAVRSGETRPDPEAIEPIGKTTFFGEDPTTFATVREGLGSRFHVLTGTMPYLGEAGGEVSLPGMNKGSAIVTLASRIGVPLVDVIAIGDSANDVEMLEVAGVGIAMGNADGDIKARADEVTASVTADGVWKAFRRHGLAG